MMSQVTVRSVVYQIDGQSYESRLAFDASHQGPLPGLLMAPNWMGVGAGAEEIAGGEAVALVEGFVEDDARGGDVGGGGAAINGKGVAMHGLYGGDE
eukprot:gene20350-26071_t